MKLLRKEEDKEQKKDMSQIKPIDNLSNGQAPPMRKYIPIEEEFMSKSGGLKRAEPSPPISSNLEVPLKDSKGLWRTPKNVREFASQANMVATKILNEEIDIDKARAYSAVVRTVAQAITSEVQKARYLRSEPDLNFVTKEDEDEK